MKCKKLSLNQAEFNWFSTRQAHPMEIWYLEVTQVKFDERAIQDPLGFYVLF